MLAFNNFTLKYGREYQSQFEEAHRYKIFKGNYELINSHNEKEASFLMETNYFADITEEELKMTFLGVRVPEGVGEKDIREEEEMFEVPEEVNWLLEGTVS
mmetsp:Transcript_14493/g.14107  ORF Transcript_14493/g.14107 Transcript_14493/m.14107 type:complete len:101 (-) Transcript_14493:551-853(-)